MIPYGRQSIDQSDIDAVVSTLRSNWLTQGPQVEEFEKKLAQYCGAKYAVAVCNGTAALHLAYLAVGLQAGDEVITTPNTFVATSNMLLAVGAKPVFCDIRLDTLNIDDAKIEKLITKKTKAIVPVHFGGQPVEMKKILAIAKKYKLAVVEDACHALGAKYQNKKVGSLKSDATVFSFHPVKPITTGEGGAIVTNNKKYFEKMKLLRSHGVVKNFQGKNIMTALGFNYRLTDFQAALGSSQLKKLDYFIKERHQKIKWYTKYLQGIEGIILPTELKGNYSGWHLYIIMTRDQKQRDHLSDFLKKKGIAVNFHYPAVYSQPYYRDHGYKKVLLKTEEVYQNSCITLPCFPKLTEKEVRYIADSIKYFFDHN